jgi:hypothetical protein
MPLYGRWHALVSRLLVERDHTTPVADPDSWVQELNLDPRWRVAAALGTRVMQKRQEEFMNAAWSQVGDVLAANRLMRLLQLAREAALFLHQRHLGQMDAARRVHLTAPAQRRVLKDGVTVRQALLGSALAYASVAPAFRRTVRARGRLARRLSLGAPGAAAHLVMRLDLGQITAAPPWLAPSGNTVSVVQGQILTAPAPPGQTISPAERKHLADSLAPSARTPSAIAHLPMSPDFVATHIMMKDAAAPTHGATDSAEAKRFKQALTDAYALMAPGPPEAAPEPFGVDTAAAHMQAALDPGTTLPARYQAVAAIPQRIAVAQDHPFVPAMAYPVIDVPMYKPLSDLSSELFLPNINFIPQNSITLLENNQRFIESYLIGLNHEMGRELLWREYPTDQRGSVFRQFWDVSGAFSTDPPKEAERELLRDIKKIHTWPMDELGRHNNRVSDPAKANLVLVIRGELLKRYPNAVIYAQKAAWGLDAKNMPTRAKERTLCDIPAAQQDDPPATLLKMPLFEARVDPDIFFIGFDLVEDQAYGAGPNDALTNDNAGWFFVLKERPGEPRFGANEPQPDSPPNLMVNWECLSWAEVGAQRGACVRLDHSVPLVPNPDPLSSLKPDPADAAAHFTPQTTAAELAYILYRVPIMVAVHASQMMHS